jgi:hypothetical protein
MYHLVKFILKYFNFEATINGIAVMISSLVGSLLLYKNVLFYMLIFLSYKYLSSFISCNSFVDKYFAFSIDKIMSSANMDNLTFSFPVWPSFFSFAYLIAFSETSYIK